MACIGEIKAIFWARGVENIYIEQPVEQYRVLESSEGYWIGKLLIKRYWKCTVLSMDSILYALYST